MTPRLQPLSTPAEGGGFVMPADGYFQLAPKGEFPHDSGVVQVIDDEAIRSMAESFSPGDEILVDVDHQSHRDDKPTAAAGWIQGLIARADGLFAKIKFSKTGAEAVSGGMYRFLSPVWLAADCESLGNNRVRPLRLYDAALTNRPNLKGIAPLSNREKQGENDEAETPEPKSAEEAFYGLIQLEAFHALVQNRRMSHNVPFSVAYEACKNIHGQAYRNMLREAATTQSRGTDTRLGQLLNAVIPGDQEIALTCPPIEAGKKFTNLVAVYRKKNPTWSFERAWDWAQRMHPTEYGNAMRLNEILEEQNPTQTL